MMVIILQPVNARFHLAKPAPVAAALAIALLLAACVRPLHEPPAPAMLDARALELPAPAVTAVDARWWQELGDPQLGALIDAALVNNPELAEVRARIGVALAQADAAQARLAPQASAGLNEGFGRLPENFLIPPPYAGQTGWSNLLTSTLRWNLDVWGRDRAALAAADATAQATAFDVAQSQLLLQGAIAQSYIEFQLATTLARLDEQAALAWESIGRISRVRATAGLESRQAEQDAARVLPAIRQTLLQSQLRAGLAENALLTLSGRSAASATRLAAPRLELDALLPLPVQLPINLLARRPDILAARARVASSVARHDEALAAFYPSVDLNLLVGFASLGLDNIVRGSSRTWSATAAVGLPLFDGGQLQAGQRQRTSERDAAIADYNRIALAAVRQAADLLLQQRQLQLQHATQLEALTAADQTTLLAQARNNARLDSELPRLRAALQQLQLRKGEAELTAQLALTRIRLLLALGGSFDSSDVPVSRAGHTP
jgi:NodT family efflux transporter outer membrane factor (OMF) lipoprotein